MAAATLAKAEAESQVEVQVKEPDGPMELNG